MLLIYLSLHVPPITKQRSSGTKIRSRSTQGLILKSHARILSRGCRDWEPEVQQRPEGEDEHGGEQPRRDLEVLAAGRPRRRPLVQAQAVDDEEQVQAGEGRERDGSQAPVGQVDGHGSVEGEEGGAHDREQRWAVAARCWLGRGLLEEGSFVHASPFLLLLL